MAHKILVADDSQTIQKVIAITLASEPYQITQAGNESQLMDFLEGDFDLIIYDFNLSDDVSGYELSKNIRIKANDSALLAMLGTFDSVDDEKLKNHGANDSIVKPFESGDFIAKCAYLTANKSLKNNSISSITNVPEMPKDSLPPLVDSENKNSNQEDDWEISSPAFSEELDQEKSSVDFRSELKDWVGHLPDVIGKSSKEEFLPPVIENDFIEDDPTGNFELPHELKKDSTHKAPAAEDLEYPDLEASNTESTGENFWAVDEIEIEKGEDFKIEDDFEEEQQAVDKKFDDGFLYDGSTHQTELEQTLFDEISKEDLNVNFDGFADSSDHTGEIELASLQGDNQNFSLNEDEIVEKLMIKLIPLVREEIKKYCEKNVDKVAWEVIPDLAENLIKKEINQISSSIK